MKYIRFQPLNGLVSEEGTPYVYEVGETITVNSTELYKCVSITEEYGNIYYNFKQGKKIYTFDW